MLNTPNTTSFSAAEQVPPNFQARNMTVQVANRFPASLASLATYLHYHNTRMLPNILLLITLLYLHPPVFLNTSYIYQTLLQQSQPHFFSAITALQAPPTMDVFKQACPPQDNPLSIPMALTHHHFSECTMQTSVHFSSVRGMEQLKEKQEKFYAARQQRIQLQQGKLRKVNDLPKCCER